jgi:GTPase SAR1 family protein
MGKDANERGRYVKNQFQPANTTSTVGASFLTKRVVDDESDTVVRLQIWDTAGQERFRFVSSLFLSQTLTSVFEHNVVQPGI